MYKNVTKEIFAELLSNRISQPDCNWGYENEVVEETKPEINPEVVETFNKIYEEFIKEHILVFTIENQEPKELTPEKKEAYAQCVKE